MGFVRAIVRAITRQPDPVVVAQPPQVVEAPKETTQADITAQKKAALGSGYGSQTVLAGAEEGEANVSKTILGGGKKKTIKA